MNSLTRKQKNLAQKLEQDLLLLYGSPMLTGEQLQKAMNYRSIYALRQAITRKTIPVPVFTIKKRKGYFSLVVDVATWLASNALNQLEENSEEVHHVNK